MAKIYPKFVDDFHGSYGEEQIFKSLKTLNDSWTIFHSINWQKRNINGKISWGEADFVIMNKNYGILVVEVKSGGITFKDGEWYQTRLDNNEINKMKNPFSQANRSKYKFRELFENRFGFSEKIFVEKIVWFPSITDEELNNIQLPQEYDKRLILTSNSLSNPEKSIIGAYNYYNSIKFNQISDSAYKEIFNLMLPEFNLIPELSSKYDEINYRFNQLTREQEKILNFIEFQNTIAIEGGAGTGKTFIALEYARRASNNGKVLFLCFNKYLNDFLNSKYSHDNVDYFNIYGFIAKGIGASTITDNNMLKELKNIDITKLGYTTIIIDEAQDYDFSILKYLRDISVENNYNIVIFYDKNQQVIKSNFSSIIKDFDCKLTLKNNCRNTIKIQSTINSIFSLPLNYYCYSIEGIMPSMYYSDSKDSIISSIESEIDKLISNGAKIEDITILTLLTENESILSGASHIGRYEISNSREKDKIFFTTSRKFKGLESDAVIVVDFDIRNNSEDFIRNFYVSTSRAKINLLIYSNNNDWEINETGISINSDFSPIASISSKYKVKFKKI